MKVASVTCCLVLCFINSGCLTDQKFYLTKNGGGGGGYSRESRGLIPFPRTGKRATDTWLVPVTEDDDGLEATPTSLQDTTTIQHHRSQPPPNSQLLEEDQKTISKRSIPDTSAFHRRLLRSDPTQSYYRRLTKSGDSAYYRRLLRSDNAYARRLIRSQDVFNRRLIRSDPSTFYRRLLRSPSDTYKRRIFKKASLIPFPRTGKRSVDMSGEDEESVPVLQTMASYLPDQDHQDHQEPTDLELATLQDMDIQDMDQEY